jgi:hypothetical protein
MSNPFKYPLGAKATDRVTGFSGTITGRSDFIAGCRQYCITPKVGSDGKILDSHWFDEERIDVDEANSVPVTPTKTGGPTGSERAPTR